MWETPDVQEPSFDAKGIETVRRDGVPAQQKMVETTLKMLFRTQDLSEIKAYCQQSWEKILADKVSIQDLIFAREVRLGTYRLVTCNMPSLFRRLTRPSATKYHRLQVRRLQRNAWLSTPLMNRNMGREFRISLRTARLVQDLSIVLSRLRICSRPSESIVIHHIGYSHSILAGPVALTGCTISLAC